MQKENKVTETSKLIEANKPLIDSWKEQHKRVRAITVTSRLLKKDFSFIIAKPTPMIMDAVASYEHQGKMNKIEEILVENCVKAGDKEVFKQDLDVKNSVMASIMDMFEKLQKEEQEL